MTGIKFTYFFALLCCLSLLSCQDDDFVMESAKYGEGIYISNEGPFGSGTGTVSFYNRNERTIQNDIFQAENNGAVLGNVVQSMTGDATDTYIVVNNAAKVTRVETGSMAFIEDIEGLAIPRYAQISGDKVYISLWGTTGLEGAVAVYNSVTSSIEKTIATGSGAERMEMVGSDLYVVNAGGFGRDSSVVIIDTNSDELRETIVVGDNPTSIEADANGAIWVLCTGYSDWNDASQNTDGKLVKIVDNTVVLSLAVANGANDLVISPDGATLYFSANGAVMQHDVTATTLAADPVLINRSFYSLGVDTNGNILAGDAKDFASNGEVVIYSPAGEELESFEAGIIPGNFFVK